MNFGEYDFVLVALEDFFEGEKLFLRFRGPHRFINAPNDNFYRLGDVRNGFQDDFHWIRLILYFYKSLVKELIIYHVLVSEMRTTVSLLVLLLDQYGSQKVRSRFKGLTKVDDVMKPRALGN